MNKLAYLNNRLSEVKKIIESLSLKQGLLAKLELNSFIAHKQELIKKIEAETQRTRGAK